ncbi:MAG TPA: CPBP family intramembrane glutamic endopeptidase [Steroidobacteraceae bacterium]|nr:CPBP family intramembrane glutamic endopeptidase [Steroidobacteraceae bacterium]
MRALVQKLSAVQEAALITTIFAGWFICSAFWVVLTGFPVAKFGYDNSKAIALVVFELIAFCLAALVLRWRGWQLREFLFSVQWRDVLAAVLLLMLSVLVNFVLWYAITSHFDDGSILRKLAHPVAMSVGAAALMSIVNGAFEEFFLCRYLIERFRSSGAAFAVMLSAGIRMLYHVYQGPHGTLAVLAYGVIAGAYYWRTRSLGAVVLAHALADLIALT